ncbi:hypothetical protein [Stackebrandtia endophytica]
MQIWTPRWTVSPPERHGGTSRFGGLPRGLAVERWPVCGECGVAMTPLLQLAAGPWLPRIPVGHVLSVFKCEGLNICDFWKPDDVANRCLLVPETDLDSDAAVPASVEDGRTTVLPTFWISEWVASDDGITPEQADAINDPDRFWGLPDELQDSHGFDSLKLTKAGGPPYWTGNGPSREPERPRELLFQIDNWITLIDSPQAVADYLADASELVAVSDNVVSAANFMSDGIAFIFDVTPSAPLPTPKLVINR